MPDLQGGKLPTKEEWPLLFKQLLKSSLQILKGEQLRVGAGGKEESDVLVSQVTSWAYNLEPFRGHPWTVKTKPLDYWKALANDSNAKQLAVCLSHLSPGAGRLIMQCH